MFKIKPRICIGIKDIMQIESCSERTASKRMNNMRSYFNKIEKRCKITFKDYSTYSGIPLEDLESFRLR